MSAVAPNPVGPDSVGVVTVNWNGWRMTLECLAALRQSEGADWRLYVVDNASGDDSRERLRGMGHDAVLIESPVNGGWTGGNNLGLAAALAAGHRWILVLNNDALVEPDTLARLTATAQAEPRAILGPVHLTGDGRAYDYVGTELDPRTGFPRWLPVDEAAVAALPALIPTATIKGAGIFAAAEAFREVGPFEDRFYLNYDETDWCYRARAAGGRLLMVKDARILHAGSGSIGGMTSPLQSYFLARNALLFAERHCTPAQRWRYLRDMWWEARDLPRGDPARRGWFWRFVMHPSPAQLAYRRGIADYARRRFGDCPPAIRALGRPA